MEVNNNDLRLILFGCFRYSLGRKTYMPSSTCDLIKKYKKIFTKYDFTQMIEETTLKRLENLK